MVEKLQVGYLELEMLVKWDKILKLLALLYILQILIDYISMIVL